MSCFSRFTNLPLYGSSSLTLASNIRFYFLTFSNSASRSAAFLYHWSKSYWSAWFYCPNLATSLPRPIFWVSFICSTLRSWSNLKLRFLQASTSFLRSFICWRFFYCSFCIKINLVSASFPCRLCYSNCRHLYFCNSFCFCRSTIYCWSL